MRRQTVYPDPEPGGAGVGGEGSRASFPSIGKRRGGDIAAAGLLAVVALVHLLPIFQGGVAFLSSDLFITTMPFAWR
jgi:hypothetical protein